jgi:hypothetical protein
MARVAFVPVLFVILVALPSCYTQHKSASLSADCGNRRIGVLVLDDNQRPMNSPLTHVYDALNISGFQPVLLNEMASKALLQELKSTSLVVSYSAGVLKATSKAEVKLDRLVENFSGQMGSSAVVSESAAELKRIATELKLDLILLLTNTSVSNLDFDATAIIFRTDSFNILASWSMRRSGHTAGLAVGAMFTWGLAGFGFIGAESKSMALLMDKVAENVRGFRCSR